MKKSIVMAGACLEIIMGLCCILVPDLPCRLLFAAAAEGLAVPVARFAGVALLGLGVACLPSKHAGSLRSAVLGLLVFNLGVPILFAWVGVTTSFRGPLLWPAVILHAIIAAALLPQISTEGSPAK
jgi:hypothetical protein